MLYDSRFSHINLLILLVCIKRNKVLHRISFTYLIHLKHSLPVYRLNSYISKTIYWLDEISYTIFLIYKFYGAITIAVLYLQTLFVNINQRFYHKDQLIEENYKDKYSIEKLYKA